MTTEKKDQVQARIDSAAREFSGRWDADEAFFLARQLEDVRAATYNVLYPEIKYPTLLPVMGSDPGAATITQPFYDERGEAKIVANDPSDIPLVDVIAGEETIKNKLLAAAFSYTNEDLRRAVKAGVPLDTARANRARKAIEQKLERIAALGDAAHGVPGLFRLSGPAIGTIGTTFAASTPDQIMDFLHAQVNTIATATNGQLAPDTMILPIADYTYIASRRAGTDTAMTILQMFLQNSPFIKKVDHWHFASLANAAGNGKRGVIYKSDPEVVSMEIALPFVMHEPERRGLAYVVPCEAKTAGVFLHHPTAVRYIEGM